jgi:hypothetical protein
VFNFATEQRLRELERDLASAFLSVPCERCRKPLGEHPRADCAGAIEPYAWPEPVWYVSAALASARRMAEAECGYCGVAVGAHGLDLMCHCGHPREAHTVTKLITPKTQLTTTLYEMGPVEQLRGEPAYERAFCKWCKFARWADDPKYIEAKDGKRGRCAGWETPPFAELCEPHREARGGPKKYERPYKKSGSKWWRELEIVVPTLMQASVWKAARAIKKRDEDRKAERRVQETNAALLAGPVVEKAKRRRAT